MDTLGEVLEQVRGTYAAYLRKRVDLELSPHDDMINLDGPYGMTHYLRVGANALENILQAMVLCTRARVTTILDMPCGFGRVTRHLAAAFPDVGLHVCDLYQDRIDFCAQQYGATPIKSRERFSEITFNTGFDLIWAGSLLTHLPENLFAEAFALFSRSLNLGGIGIVTLHGRHSPFIQHNRWKYLADSQFSPAEEAFCTSGFGYADYDVSGRYSEQKAYGISLSSPSYVLQLLARDESIRIRGYIERGWDGHQDVAVFQKYPINS